MPNWTIDDLRRLDRKYAEAGVHLHQRPFRAALELLGPAFQLGSGDDSQVRAIVNAYEEMLPETKSSWPGMGAGLAASVDQVRRVVVDVIYGAPRRIEVWHALGFASQEAWWHWCREDPTLAAGTHFSFADLFDFTYGVDDQKGQHQDADTLWQMASSNLEDVATILRTGFSVDSVIQPICLVVELSLKAALVFNGAAPKSFKGPSGHDLSSLGSRLAKELPHRHDPLVAAVIARLPPYVGSRYAPAGLTRLEVVRLALGAQFVAAASVRRISNRDVAAQMEGGGWPAPRPPFFP